MKSLVLSVIFLAMLNCGDAQTGIPQIISLLDSVNDTTNSIASTLPHMAKTLQEAYQNHTTDILDKIEKSMSTFEADQHPSTVLLSLLANAQIQMASTQAQIASSLTNIEEQQNQTTMLLSQMANSQMQMANTLTQAVLIFQSKLLSSE